MTNSAVQLALLGPGLVGSEVLRQLNLYMTTALSPVAAAHHLKSVYPEIHVVAVANSRRMILSSATAPLLLDLAQDWPNLLKTSTEGVPLNLDTLASHFKQRPWPTIIVDCTSSQELALLYPQWLKQGWHVVTPNKKAFSGDLGLWREISKLTVRRPGVAYPLCLHEATVGAGLPVISTLKDLMMTGDRIMRIEGVFSGTLSFLFNTFSSCSPDEMQSSPQKFSEIVKEAKEKGYTEPDPRDDLNGMDVARKVVILSRVANMDLVLESLPVMNVVPPNLRSCTSIEEFMKRLPEADDYFDQLKAEAETNGEVLRYVGVVQDSPGKNGRSSEVALRRYPKDHPFAQLKGSDNIIAFYTERFSQSPLIIQGAGAGASVTAHGVMSDLLRVAEITMYQRP